MSKAIGGVFGGLVVPPAALGALRAAAERAAAQDRVDAGLIADHEQIADAYALLHRTTRPASLFLPVAGQADTLYGLLDQPASQTLQERLYVVAAGSHAQAGLLAFVSGDRVNARRYFALALDVAEDSRNDMLHAQTLSVASVAHREPGGRAAAMMAQAVDLAANADGDTRAWLGSWHAIRLAIADDTRGFFNHMHRANQLHSGRGDEGGFFIRYAVASWRNHLELGVGLATLKRGDDALEVFAAAPDPMSPRDRAYMLAHRAKAQLVKRRPEPEAASADLLTSFKLGHDHGASTAVERVRRIRAEFPKKCAGSACLAELDERLSRV